MDLLEHKCSLQELAERLGVNFDTGISMERAKYTLERDGPNELSPPTTTPEWVRLCRHMFNWINLMLWTASCLCFIVFSIHASTLEEPPGDDLYLGFLLAGIVIINSCFSYFQEVKSSRIMESFKKLAPQFAVVIRKNEKMNIHAEELVVGDIVEVKTGDVIPADMRIIAARGFKVDNTALTGESEPKVRTADYTSENPLETRNLVFYSTSVVEGVARCVVIGTGDRTVMGRIAKIAARMEVGEETLIAHEIRYLITVVAVIGVSVSLLFFFLWMMVESQFLHALWVDALIYLIGLIIACVPEGILPVITLCLVVAAKVMADKNCLVKNLEAVETLGSTSVICSDKTGTLTQNKMSVSHMWFDNQVYDADLSDNQQYAMYNRDNVTWMCLARAIMLCNRAEFRGQDHGNPLRRNCVGDSTEVALLRFVELAVGNSTEFRQRNRKVCEIPFNSVIKYQVSIHEMDDPRDQRYLLVMTGAPERVFDRCSTIMINGEEQRISSGQWRQAFHHAFVHLGTMGERVVGVCDLRLPIDQYPHGYPFDIDEENFPQTGLRFLGMVSMIDPPKAAVPDAINRCHMAGIKVIMITGDHPITAKAIAKGVGIISEGSETMDDIASRLAIPIQEVLPRDARACVVHGADLRDMTPAQLDNVLSMHPELVFARTTPHQKLIIVEACQRQGTIVAVTGDGVHDTPALKKADIGIAMGISGLPVSKEAADVILLDDNFASIVSGIEEGRLTFDNLKKTVAYTMTSNFPEMAAFMMCIIAHIPLPLGALTIIFIELGTDILPSISLCFENPEGDIMRKMPRDTKRDRLCNRGLFATAFGQNGLIETFGAFFTYFAIMAEAGFWPQRLLGLRSIWGTRGVNDLEDAFGQEWSFGQRITLQYTCQTAFFFSIVMMQWANLIACKTRTQNVLRQGFGNAYMIWALILETFLAFFFIYCPGMDKGLRMYPIRWHWWFAPIPFLILFSVYDELRKLFIRLMPGGFLEKETCY